VAQFVACYSEAYRRHQTQEPPPVAQPDVARLQQLLAMYAPAELEELLEVFFESHISYVQRHHYSLGAFTHAVNFLKLLKVKHRRIVG
jgi:hypothetical protein